MDPVTVAAIVQAAAEAYEQYNKDKSEQEWQASVSSKLDAIISITQAILVAVNNLGPVLRNIVKENDVVILVSQAEASRKSRIVALAGQPPVPHFSPEQNQLNLMNLNIAQNSMFQLMEFGYATYATVFATLLLTVSWYLIIDEIPTKKRAEIIKLCELAESFLRDAKDPNKEGSFGSIKKNADHALVEYRPWVDQFNAFASHQAGRIGLMPKNPFVEASLANIIFRNGYYDVTHFFGGRKVDVPFPGFVKEANEVIVNNGVMQRGWQISARMTEVRNQLLWAESSSAGLNATVNAIDTELQCIANIKDKSV